jgi:threonine synthase
MKYYSTTDKNHRVTLQEAVLQGLAPGQGLYMPEQIPGLPKSFFDSISSLTFQEIGLHVASKLVGEDIPSAELERIVKHTIQFDAPLIEIEKDIFALELFHGPTLAFKDFGARFLSGLLGFFANQQEKEIVILVATSGDTGSAVANGFYNVPGTKVVVLYPSGKVSDIQEKQFTTLGGNITALEVDGTFDDCQRMVKLAFSDVDLKRKLFLTSANSINIARLIPQSFYYFYAYSQLQNKNNSVVFSVPSGNFGNLTAGLIAKRMGLPVDKFIAATNINKIVPDFFSSKVFMPMESVSTISNAMDVGNPSNFPRMYELYGNDFDSLSADVVSYYFNDEETRAAMRDVYHSSNYVMDPHGAVGYLGLKKYLKENVNVTGVFLETAHPAKFREVVEETLQNRINLPPRLEEFMSGTKRSIKISSHFSDFKSLLPTLIP